MKVLGINGSPHGEGNTFTALTIAGEIFAQEGIEYEIFNVGMKAVQGCTGCGACSKKKNEECIFSKDVVNEGIQKMKEAQGIILGSPVHFSGISGNMKSFLDRAFYVAGSNGGLFRHKVGASIAAVRRSGGVTTFDQLNHYLNYSEMVIATGNYWNVIHGRMPGEAEQDSEGAQAIEVTAQNMVWLMRLIEKGREMVPEPKQAKKIYMHFIR
ncbi:MAG: flavodoxin family protein [Eubacteriaceae bacterium]